MTSRTKSFHPKTLAVAPSHWAESHTRKEYTVHQLSPYIGKLKSTIARDLIAEYSCAGDLVVDMFCGSGTVPYEAACLGRHVFASDRSKYAVVLTKGKLRAPKSPKIALSHLDGVLKRAKSGASPDLRNVPRWVRSFFHPRTLKEIIQIAEILKSERRYFLLGSLLGILHHQRPGFLSFPSSHLVPYLRTDKFPKCDYPELYQYREVAPRLRRKVERMLARPGPALDSSVRGVRQSPASGVSLPDEIGCVITSPPYMNALDYGRDNRLRLWLLDECRDGQTDRVYRSRVAFRALISDLVLKLEAKMRSGGYCVFIVGERTFRDGSKSPSEVVLDAFLSTGSAFCLDKVIADTIPDIRRSRRRVRGVREELIMVFQRH